MEDSCNVASVYHGIHCLALELHQSLEYLLLPYPFFLSATANSKFLYLPHCKRFISRSYSSLGQSGVQIQLPWCHSRWNHIIFLHWIDFNVPNTFTVMSFLYLQSAQMWGHQGHHFSWCHQAGPQPGCSRLQWWWLNQLRQMWLLWEMMLLLRVSGVGSHSPYQPKSTAL